MHPLFLLQHSLLLSSFRCFIVATFIFSIKLSSTGTSSLLTLSCISLVHSIESLYFFHAYCLTFYFSILFICFVNSLSF